MNQQEREEKKNNLVLNSQNKEHLLLHFSENNKKKKKQEMKVPGTKDWMLGCCSHAGGAVSENKNKTKQNLAGYTKEKPFQKAAQGKMTKNDKRDL